VICDLWSVILNLILGKVSIIEKILISSDSLLWSPSTYVILDNLDDGRSYPPIRLWRFENSWNTPHTIRTASFGTLWRARAGARGVGVGVEYEEQSLSIWVWVWVWDEVKFEARYIFLNPSKRTLQGRNCIYEYMNSNHLFLLFLENEKSETEMSSIVDVEDRYQI